MLLKGRGKKQVAFAARFIPFLAHWAPFRELQRKGESALLLPLLTFILLHHRMEITPASLSGMRGGSSSLFSLPHISTHTHTDPHTFEPVRMFGELRNPNWSWRRRLEFVCALITGFIEVPVRCCAPLHQAPVCDGYLTPAGTPQSAGTALSPSISLLPGHLIDVALASVMRLDWKWTWIYCGLEAIRPGFDSYMLYIAVK